MVIDDDVVRVRSHNFEMETGMPLVNNPEKGMGAVQNVCVAMPSGFFLGSHFSLKGQGAKEAVKIILLDLAGRGVVLQEQMHGRITNGTGLDRGYQQEDLLHTMNDWVVPVIGTLNRCKFEPFTFGRGVEGMRIDVSRMCQQTALVLIFGLWNNFMTVRAAAFNRMLECIEMALVNVS